MIGVLARKNIMMSNKMEHMSKRTTREKLLSYLGDVARQKSNKSFDIPYNRQELADYLSVERSALSAEMSKLKTIGIIDYKKNHIELLKEADQ
jgi:CRP-like cAMP-binding protein